jgi:hypothetical protein
MECRGALLPLSSMDDDDVYLDKLQTNGVKKCISSLYVEYRLQAIRHKEK